MDVKIRPLLDRLETIDQDDVRSPSHSAKTIIDFIRENLQLVLNSRKHNSPSVPDFGISDFADFFRGKLTPQMIQDEIKHCIEKYEPRLTNVEVRFTPQEDDPFRLHLDIHANIVSDDDETPTVFHTVVEGSGTMTGKVLFQDSVLPR